MVLRGNGRALLCDKVKMFVLGKGSPARRSADYWGQWGAPDPVLGGGLAQAQTRVTVTLSEGRQSLISNLPH